jgi:hypothetical protein
MWLSISNRSLQQEISPHLAAAKRARRFLDPQLLFITDKALLLWPYKYAKCVNMERRKFSCRSLSAITQFRSSEAVCPLRAANYSVQGFRSALCAARRACRWTSVSAAVKHGDLVPRFPHIREFSSVNGERFREKHAFTSTRFRFN